MREVFQICYQSKPFTRNRIRRKPKLINKHVSLLYHKHSSFRSESNLNGIKLCDIGIYLLGVDRCSIFKYFHFWSINLIPIIVARHYTLSQYVFKYTTNYYLKNFVISHLTKLPLWILRILQFKLSTKVYKINVNKTWNMFFFLLK